MVRLPDPGWLLHGHRHVRRVFIVGILAMCSIGSACRMLLLWQPGEASRRKCLAEIKVKHQHGHAPMRCSTSSTVIRERPSHSLLTTMLPLLHSIGFRSLVSLQFITKSCIGTIGAHGAAFGSFAESSSNLMLHCCADRSPASGVPCHGYSVCRQS